MGHYVGFFVKKNGLARNPMPAHHVARLAVLYHQVKREQSSPNDSELLFGSI